VVELGSTAAFVNSVIASWPTGVSTDASSTVTMTNTLWDTVPTQTVGSVTQHGLIVGSASFEADGYHIQPGSAAVAQGVVSTLANDIDGELRPRPAGILPDLGADEIDAGGLISGRTATPIAVGETKSATAPAGGFSDHVLALSASEVPVLRVRVEAVDGTAGFRLLVRSRQYPLAALFDVEGEAVDATTREVVVAAPAPGDWYLGVLATAGQVPFTISVAGADRGVASITPSSGGNTGPVTVRFDGAGFEEGVSVELRSGGVTILSAAPSSLTSTQLTARLVLTGVAPQPCDACVVWPDATTHCAPGGFRIVGGIAPAVDAHLSIPGVLRGGRGTTGVLSWENRGNVDADAPLFVVASDQDLPMRRDSREGWRRGALRFLGIDQASFGSAGVLPPGARGRVTFEIFSEGPAHAPATFTLQQLSAAALSRAIDWAALEPSLRPEGIDAATWSRIFPLVTGAVGSTWGHYVGALRANASYLSGLGRHLADPEALFGVTVQRTLETSPQQSLASGVDALCPAPGPLLTFGRSFANGPLGRATVGALGVGWTHTYDQALATLASGDREIRSNDGSARLFRLLPDGTFRGLPGDHGRLVVSGATARLVERYGVALSFRADGRLASISDATGNRLDVTWDANGRLSRVTHSNGDAFDFDHDTAGRLVRLTDHAGQVTSYSYDGASRRLVQVTQPGGRVTRYAYLGAGLDADALVSIEFPDGSHVFYEYDGSGRLVGNRRDTGPETSFSRDAAGRIVQAHGAPPRGAFAALAPPEGGVLLALDESGRLGELVDPLGNAVGLGWNDDGDLGEVIDPFGDVSSIEHGPLGEVTALLQSGGIETRQSYSYPEGGGRFVRSLSDPRANVSAFAHDAAGRVTSITYPGGSRETLERDAKGLVTSTTNRRGQTIQYSRNGRGQLTRKALPDGTTVDYTYDAAGRLATVTEAGGTTRLTWDSRGFLSEILYPGGKWFRYEMDDVGRTTRRTSDDGYVLDWQYDASGRLSRVTRNAAELVVAYQYDTLGRLGREDRGNGTATTYGWDAASRLVSLTHLAPGGGTLASYAYTYDAGGHVTSATTPDGIWTFTYDIVGRLVSEREPSGILTSYRYDDAGNRVQIDTNGVVVTWTVNGQNQVTQAGTTAYTWDADGNLATRTMPSGTTNFTWDSENRLTQVAGAAETAAYAYNAFGQLASQTVGGVTSSFVHDVTSATSAAATVLGAAGQLAARYDEAAGLAAAVDAAGIASSYHFDGVGNTARVTGPSGAATNAYSYDANGNVTSSTGPATNPFTTGGSDGTSSAGGGLLAGNTVPYDPLTGRWATKNDSGYSGGANLYTKWNNDPAKPAGPPITLSSYVVGGAKVVKMIGLQVAGRMPKKTGFPTAGTLVGGVTNSITGIVQVYNASEKNDTLGVIEGLGNSALANLNILSTAVPPLVVPVKIANVIATVGKNACNLYVRNLAPNSDPYWFQPVARNKYFYLQRNIARAGITPADLELLERTPSSDQVFPLDPNEKAATPGSGPRHLVRAGTRLYYAVSFENVATASAPAQEVFVTDSLDSGLDLATLELVDAGWGATTVAAPKAALAFHARTAITDYRPGDLRPWWVDLDVRESAPGRLAFTFRTLDPATGGLPADALAGFLPPEDGSGRGKGSVLFSVRTKSSLAPGTRIVNSATIVFDTEAPITTNEVFHTIGLPGDVNDDGVVNPADVFYLVNTFYSAGPAPLGIADANFDGKVDALDLFYLINYLYAGGPAPQ
jgi:YD repeat-containing protein